MNIRKSSIAMLVPALTVAVVVLGLLPFAPAAQAITIVPDCARNQTAAPPLSCVLETFINVANLIFSIAGSAALLMFVVGGFFVLTSAGNESRVTKGKEFIKNAVIGLFIIFAAAYVIQYGEVLIRGGAGGAGPGGAASTCAGQIVTKDNGKTECVLDCGTYSKAVGVAYKCFGVNDNARSEPCVPDLCGAETQTCCLVK